MPIDNKERSSFNSGGVITPYSGCSTKLIDVTEASVAARMADIEARRGIEGERGRPGERDT
jgi:hypothetical protein